MKVTDLTELTTPDPGDTIYIVDNSGTPTSKRTTLGAIDSGNALMGSTGHPNAVAIHPTANAPSDDSISIGNGSAGSSMGVRSVSVGASTSVTAERAVAIGRSTVVSSIGGISIGDSAGVQSNNAISVGRGAFVDMNSISSIAIGLNTYIEGDSGIAIGDTALATAANVIAIGKGASAPFIDDVSIGNGAEATDRSGVAIGVNSLAGKFGTAIGDSARAENWDGGVIVEYSTALGKSSEAQGNYSTALGAEAWATGALSCAVGSGSFAPNDNEGVLGGTEAWETNKWVVPGGFTTQGEVHMSNLPTTDPVVAGQIWNDAGTLKVSSG